MAKNVLLEAGSAGALSRRKQNLALAYKKNI
jgi:hypothetical protein